MTTAKARAEQFCRDHPPPDASWFTAEIMVPLLTELLTAHGEQIREACAVVALQEGRRPYSCASVCAGAIAYAIRESRGE